VTSLLCRVGYAVQQLPAIQVQVVGGREARHVGAEVADERRLFAERQRPHPRVHPVGAHDQVEGSRLAALEGGLQTVVALGDVGDGVVEDVLDVVAGGRVEDTDQVAAQDLELGDGAAGVAQQVGGHARQPPVVAVNVGHPARADVRPPDVVQDAHALGHGARRPAQVDRLAAGARCGRPLHHRGVEAMAAQPVRHRGSGDARTGDENVPVVHLGLLASVVVRR
jgi:hypothetical protein